MSGFSGKCDFYDTVERYGLDFILNKCDIYVGEIGPLKLNSHSIIKYYPYIIGSMGMSKEGGTIKLSQTSYIDSRIEEKRNIYIKEYKSIGTEYLSNNIDFTLIQKILSDKSLKRTEKKELLSDFIPRMQALYLIKLEDEFIKDYISCGFFVNSDFIFLYLRLKKYYELTEKYNLTPNGLNLKLDYFESIVNNYNFL